MTIEDETRDDEQWEKFVEWDELRRELDALDEQALSAFDIDTSDLDSTPITTSKRTYSRYRPARVRKLGSTKIPRDLAKQSRKQQALPRTCAHCLKLDSAERVSVPVAWSDDYTHAFCASELEFTLNNVRWVDGAMVGGD